MAAVGLVPAGPVPDAAVDPCAGTPALPGIPMERGRLPPRFWWGMVLLLTNQPLGWGGLLVCGLLAVRTGRRFYYALGAGIYGFTWLMFGAGVLLAGPAGLAYSRTLLRRCLGGRARPQTQGIPHAADG
ncbi:MAG: hypothetical protein K9N49_00740 [Candidatus Marinimicrobia bacterium]|nr:hypothetical protein [Candidatus Neomarinimicrobiota bacterium]